MDNSNKQSNIEPIAERCEYPSVTPDTNKYTIIFTRFMYGQMIQIIEKEKVKAVCEKLKALNKLNNENAYISIEVVNNNTGEIREYWNNKENKINF